ncbi:ParA family protein [Methylobacterium radiotolerans]|jgi:chromosome partitioning protein|uniref:ParA family protein n=1 Tax=Methylobacterium radiotolerans TaxID=31998 RepID=UPI0038D21DC9
MAASAIPQGAVRRRKIILVTANKGGVGKTTIAAHIAVAAAQEGLDVCAIDFDPQESLFMWGGQRPRSAAKVEVVTAPLDGYQNALAKQQDRDVVVIDTPPGLSSRTTSIQGLARLADLVIIPATFDFMDLQQVLPYGAALREAIGRRPTYVVNKYDRRMSDREVLEIRTHMEICGDVHPVNVRKLAAIQAPFRDGLTVLDDEKKLHAFEMLSIWSSAKKEIERV